MKIIYEDIDRWIEVEGDADALEAAIEDLEGEIEDECGHHSGTTEGDDFLYSCYQSAPEDMERALELWVERLRERGFTVSGEGVEPAPPPLGEIAEPGPLSRPSSLAEGFPHPSD